MLVSATPLTHADPFLLSFPRTKRPQTIPMTEARRGAVTQSTLQAGPVCFHPYSVRLPNSLAYHWIPAWTHGTVECKCRSSAAASLQAPVSRQNSVLDVRLMHTKIWFRTTVKCYCKGRVKALVTGCSVMDSTQPYYNLAKETRGSESYTRERGATHDRKRKP